MAETRYIILTGTAGSGKSSLAGALKEEIEGQGYSAITVNLDPAALVLPYEPNVDSRNYVDYEGIMREGLGPNGALIAAVDTLALHGEEIAGEIESYQADYAILDTPGQMEVFVYRVGGPALLKSLVKDSPAVNVYLVDALFFRDPLSISSAFSLAGSVFLRLMMPQLNVATKVDLLDPEIRENIIPRLSEDGFLEGLIEDMEGASEQAKYLAIKTVEALRVSGFIQEPLQVSILWRESVLTLFGGIQTILAGGESRKL
ncbi:MAG: ATP/GTP-binding protein [Desulfurococcales archaeon]|nr:ATP/GTP-binding protein [Desulfurococcales archaeon]